ncbi:Citrate lyase alpha chain [Candidatus Izimaplasma bacterium HR1]|jgi:citrate lyase subunit alpha/citrate CoA-transferase|uniref:citrate lyase subunit alpha n=1 Tax=Candidatus Izimoplasma sp. HR1 TaxID=1541959 RepID=UPI0004F88894|nr:Citrate lyase alpha chain [Candidatus Izimaplasma bacterium HR1]
MDNSKIIKQIKFINSLDEFFQVIPINENKNISFHHHLRNGDYVLNMVLDYYIKNQITDINLFPSAIFPSYTNILELLKNNQINNITTNYLNGPTAEYITSNGLNGTLRMQTHGGRARSIIDGKSSIDIAFIACPYVDENGNGIGYKGPNKCGSLGYAIPDSEHAKIVVLVTDYITEDTISNPEIKGSNVDYIIKVDSIGDNNGIVSGTTNVTTNPIGVKIAKNTSRLLHELGVIKNGFSFQSGAGGVSLRVTKDVKDIMIKEKIKASFFSGGITKYHVEMLEENLVEKLYDVQCFDLEAISSLSRNKEHHAISASRYANPDDPKMVVKDLDVVILGATEIDYDFNVNVTTDSHQTLIGGSGGHSDTASEAKLTVIVSPLIKGRIPIIRDRVTTITTLGKNVDCFVTERGIAINPKRTDILEKLKNTRLNIIAIEDLANKAYSYTGIPKESTNHQTKIGVVEDRTYDIIDNIYKK